MKKIVPLLVLLVLPAMLYAQDVQQQSRSYLGRLGISKTDVNRVIGVQLRTRQEVQQDRLELNVLKAELEKALFPAKVNMQSVKRLLNESLQWKMKSALALIEERVALRKILGDYRYAAYMHFLHNTTGRGHGRPRASRNTSRGR